MSAEHFGDSARIDLTNPDVDVDTANDFRNGYDLEAEGLEESYPVFQNYQGVASEGWVLRWTTPYSEEDPRDEENLVNALEEAVDYFGEQVYSDSEQPKFLNKSLELMVRAPEETIDAKGELDIRSMLNELKTDNLALGREISDRYENPEFFKLKDPKKRRVLRVELGEEGLEYGIEGQSRITEEDLEFLQRTNQKNFDYEEALTELKKETAHLDDFRE